MAEQQGASGKKSQRDRGITTVTNKARMDFGNMPTQKTQEGLILTQRTQETQGV